MQAPPHPQEPGGLSLGLHRHEGISRPSRPSHRDAASRSREKRNLLVSLVIAVVVMIAEVVGGLLTNSLALLSDAGHMLTDASAVLLSLIAHALATRPKDERRTYGFHRLEILAALLNAGILVVLAGFIFYHAYERFLEPPVVDALPMLGWAILGLVANGVAVFFLAQSRESLNARAAFLHVLFDGLSSVFVVGGGIAMYFTGWFLLDPILSCVLALLIAVSAVRLGREAMHILLEGVPREIDLEAVRRAIASVPGVCGVHDLHIWSITSGLTALSAHLMVTPENLHQSDEILAAVNQEIRARFDIGHSTLQIESGACTNPDGVC
jgi:cobalt-zinc-cadmium efflux system protein